MRMFGGLLAGISTRQIMEEMAVTQNTVRAHMRMITIRMHVESRIQILERILGDRLARQRAA
jgi:DNA-binding CsgD family transcriptional regulator